MQTCALTYISVYWLLNIIDFLVHWLLDISVFILIKLHVETYFSGALIARYESVYSDKIAHGNMHKIALAESGL